MPLLARNREDAQAKALVSEIRALETEYELLRASLRKTSPLYAAVAHPEPLGADAIQQRLLDEETTLIEYSLGEDASYGWVVNRQAVRGIRLAARAEIEQSAREVYRLVTSRGTP